MIMRKVLMIIKTRVPAYLLNIERKSMGTKLICPECCWFDGEDGCKKDDQTDNCLGVTECKRFVEIPYQGYFDEE